MNFLASLSAGATVLFYSGQFEVRLAERYKGPYKLLMSSVYRAPRIDGDPKKDSFMPS